jgi:hypothetical protein
MMVVYYHKTIDKARVIVRLKRRVVKKRRPPSG